MHYTSGYRLVRFVTLNESAYLEHVHGSYKLRFIPAIHFLKMQLLLLLIQRYLVPQGHDIPPRIARP